MSRLCLLATPAAAQDTAASSPSAAVSVRQMFMADVTVGDNAKYDIISDGMINARDLSRCRRQFTHTAP